MQTVYIGTTLVNDVMLGSQRMDDVIARQYPLTIEWLLLGGGAGGGGSSGGSSNGGGGGAGIFVSSSFIAQPTTVSNSITIGTGGNGGNNTFGGNGGQSEITGTINQTAPGGGGGGGRRVEPRNHADPLSLGRHVFGVHWVHVSPAARPFAQQRVLGEAPRGQRVRAVRARNGGVQGHAGLPCAPVLQAQRVRQLLGRPTLHLHHTTAR